MLSSMSTNKRSLAALLRGRAPTQRDCLPASSTWRFHSRYVPPSPPAYESLPPPSRRPEAGAHSEATPSMDPPAPMDYFTFSLGVRMPRRSLLASTATSRANFVACPSHPRRVVLTSRQRCSALLGPALQPPLPLSPARRLHQWPSGLVCLHPLYLMLRPRRAALQSNQSSLPYWRGALTSPARRPEGRMASV